MQADVKFTDAGINKVTVVGAQTPSPVLPGNTATYGNGTAANSVNVTFNGNNNQCTVDLSVTAGLPAGATATFTPSSFSSTGAQVNSLLTISTTAATTPGTYTFTVTTTAGAGCQNGNATTTATLVVAGPATHLSVTGVLS